MDEATRKIPSHEVTYGRLRDMILFGRLQPGQAVTIQGLVRDLDAGMTPVREAIRMLTGLGLVTAVLNRGVFVRQMSVREMLELYDLRALVFGFAAERATDHVAESHKAQFEQLLQAMDVACETENANQYYELNLKFHALILLLANNQRAQAAYDDIIKEMHLFRREYFNAPGNMRQSNAEHRTLYEAIAKGAKALIILAMDKDAILPAVNKANQQKIPVVAYDRLIEAPGVFYITFDNVEVGRMQARAILEAKPKGNYVMIKGSPVDPNADFLRGGQQEVLQAAIDAGDITIVGEAYTEDWQPANAQKNMEQILTETENGVDAVVASNDGTAGGVVAALTAQGMAGIPVSGQDGDMAALNRVALGTQTVSVWKDSRQLGKAAGEIASALADGTALDAIEGATKFSGGEKGVEMNAILLTPTAITKDTVNLAIDAGHITKEAACEGAVAGVKGCE